LTQLVTVPLSIRLCKLLPSPPIYALTP